MVALIAGVKYRHQTTRFLDGAAVGVAARTRPATVRLSFSSQPTGVAVIRSDGSVVGVTPVATDVAYGLANTEYFFRKHGFLSRTASVVPAMSRSIFEVLLTDAPAPIAALAAPVAAGPRSDPPSPAVRAKPAVHRRAQHRRPGGAPMVAPLAARPPTPAVTRSFAPQDRDDVLAPTDR